MKCPSCGEAASGAFCSACGTPVHDARCASCKTTLPSGARFCTGCGTAVRPAQNRLPWLVAAGAIGALIVVLLMPLFRQQPPGGEFRQAGTFGQAGAPLAAGGMTPGQAPPLTGSIREQADRLFNRIMQARSEGDAESVSFFLPMGLTAYREAEPLDDDGLYHLSLLENEAGDPAAARRTAERVLARSPNHLLALAAAAEAAHALGESAAARAYYQRYVDAFEAERARDLTEYRDHARVLPDYYDAAQQYTQNR